MADTDELTLEQAFTQETEETTGEVETTTAAKPEAKADDKPAETKSDAATPADDKAKSDKDEPWHVKAVISEREKRQAAERERDELRQKLSATEKAKPKTSVFEDEAKFRTELDAEWDTRLQRVRYDQSHALAVRQFGKEKVEKAMDAFKTLVETDKSLATDVFDDPLPYFAMLDIVERKQKEKEAGNIQDFEAKIRAEERAKVEKEIAEKEAAKAKKREGLTPSLASARSSGSGTETGDPRIETAEEVFPT